MFSLSGYWYKRNGLPEAPADAPPLPVTDEMKQRPATALSEFYSETQGRGRHCHIEHYRRSNGNEYFFAYFDNYPHSHMVFDDHGSFMKRHE